MALKHLFERGKAMGFGAFLLVVGCGGSQSPIGTQRGMPNDGAIAGHSTTSSYATVYSFSGATDGADPRSDLAVKKKLLYGVASGGGLYGGGTIFTLSSSDEEKTLHSFRPARRRGGGVPLAGLTPFGGLFYGTTGGGSLGGAVYSMKARGTVKLRHIFGASPDGRNPDGQLLALNGTLYGVTYYGGSNGLGTVFEIGGKTGYHVLHNFGSYSDGSCPEGGLVAINGTMYGITTGGGSHQGGTIFAISATGQEQVIYDFEGGIDNNGPVAGLISVNGLLYGTTVEGGGARVGTVFSMTPSGTFATLYSFEGLPDGEFPSARLAFYDGWLYGTTIDGGQYDQGTVFRVNVATGGENVLHSFNPSAGDGFHPDAGLAYFNGGLYGTTTEGGASDEGTVYRISV